MGPNATNPHCGALEETGGAAAEGRNVNVPWPDAKMHDGDYMAAFELVVLPLARAHRPDMILVSAGFDSADGDPQGGMRLTPDGFGRCAWRVCPARARGRFAWERRWRRLRAVGGKGDSGGLEQLAGKAMEEA